MWHARGHGSTCHVANLATRITRKLGHQHGILAGVEVEKTAANAAWIPSPTFVVSQHVNWHNRVVVKDNSQWWESKTSQVCCFSRCQTTPSFAKNTGPRAGSRSSQDRRRCEMKQHEAARAPEVVPNDIQRLRSTAWEGSSPPCFPGRARTAAWSCWAHSPPFGWKVAILAPISRRWVEVARRLLAGRAWVKSSEVAFLNDYKLQKNE